MPKEGTGARVVRNTLANGAGAFTGIAISLILTPFLIRHLGLEAYGIWVLAQSLTFFGGYAAIADLGIETAAVRYVAEARAEGNREALNQTVTSAMVFFSGAAVVFTPVLILLAEPLTELFNVAPVYHQSAIYVFTLVAAQLIFDLPARAFFAVLEGAQQFATFQLVLLARALVQAALFVAVILADLGIGSLGAVSFISSGVMFLAAWILAKRAVPELHVRRRYVSRASLRKLFSFGGGLFFMRIVGTLYRHMDKLIVGIAMGPRYVTVYEIANQIHLAAATVQSIAASALTPATAYLRREREILRDMFVRGTSYTVAISLPVVVAAFVFAGPLIEAWLGATRSVGLAQGQPSSMEKPLIGDLRARARTARPARSHDGNAVARAPAARRSRSPGFSMSRWSVAARTSTSSGGTSTPASLEPSPERRRRGCR